MNACGQHNMSSIGFQGMSINSGKLVAQLYKYCLVVEFWEMEKDVFLIKYQDPKS
jgi:hypothetical protein